MSELVCYTNDDDGYIRKLAATFAASHDALTGTVEDIGNYAYVGIHAANANEWQVYRSFLTIDTSALPTDAIIIKAVLSIYMNNGFRYVTAGSDFNITVQSGQPTYPNIPLVAGDFLHSHYSGDGGKVNTADVVSAKYYDIDLTAVGMKWIKGGEITKLCLRSDADIDETGLDTGKKAYIYVYTKEAGDAYRAKLTITYAEFASVESTIKTTATASAADIAKTGGKRTLTIDNHLIQTTVVAQAVADAYLADYKDQKTKLTITKPTPPPYEIGDTVKRDYSETELPYYAATSALISYIAATSGVHGYFPAGISLQDMLIRKINLGFSAGNYVSVLELES